MCPVSAGAAGRKTHAVRKSVPEFRPCQRRGSSPPSTTGLLPVGRLGRPEHPSASASAPARVRTSAVTTSAPPAPWSSPPRRAWARRCPRPGAGASRRPRRYRANHRDQGPFSRGFPRFRPVLDFPSFRPVLDCGHASGPSVHVPVRSTEEEPTRARRPSPGNVAGLRETAVRASSSCFTVGTERNGRQRRNVIGRYRERLWRRPDPGPGPRTGPRTGRSSPGEAWSARVDGPGLPGRRAGLRPVTGARPRGLRLPPAVTPGAVRSGPRSAPRRPAPPRSA